MFHQKALMLVEKDSDKSLINVIIASMTRKVTPPSIQITTSLPPSINEQYATVEGRRILSEGARRWKKEMARQVEKLEDEGVLDESVRKAFRQSYLSVFLEFFFTSPHRRDLDGGLKISLDALCVALGLNDNRVVDLHLIKRIDPLHPRLELTLEGIAEWQFDKEYVYLLDSEAESEK